MDKEIIDKVIVNLFKNKGFEIKCSRTTLDKKDKEAIETFYQNKENYPQSRDARLALYKSHEKIQAKHTYPKKQINTVHYWGEEGYKYINGKIYGTDDYEEAIEDNVVNEEDIKEHIDILQQAIDESPRVPVDTVTVRSGHWDSGYKEGDIVVQKGFASTSYTDTVDASDTSYEYSYEIKYYVPTGSKGVLLSDESFPENLGEEELLLGRNTRQYVLNQDDDAQTVEVLILPDR